MKKTKERIKYIDYACEVSERVWWNTMKGEKFEGILIKWDSNIATVLLSDGTKKEVEC